MVTPRGNPRSTHRLCYNHYDLPRLLLSTQLAVASIQPALGQLHAVQEGKQVMLSRYWNSRLKLFPRGPTLLSLEERRASELSVSLALLFDLGSTFTKVAAVDRDTGELVAWAKAPSSVATDVTEGLRTALEEAERAGGFRFEEATLRLACSSAAGGLRLVAVGLVPELTGEAARRAALGAGAKVVGVFSYELSSAAIENLEVLAPDIVLLAGGTDGGNRQVILHNAACLARAQVRAPVVVAGNKVVAEPVAEALRAGGKEVWVSENVLPSLDVLNVEPARRVIREVFIRRIVQAKGFDRASSFVQGVVMPTPTAVMRAAELLARGPGSSSLRSGGHGLGQLLVVDVGGATTDVHSIGKGEPTQAGWIPKGLPEPECKRTVEGDLGMRCNAMSILEAVGLETFHVRMRRYLGGNAAGETDGPERVRRAVEALTRETWRVPGNAWEVALDAALGACAVDVAVGRHAGHVEELYTPAGKATFVYGKDLTDFGTLIGTGGPLVSSPYRWEMLRAALGDPQQPLCLKPRSPRLLCDDRYVLFAAGLLAEKDQRLAFRLLTHCLASPPTATLKSVVRQTEW